MTDIEYDTKAILAKAIEALPEKTHLYYVDYRDELTDEQCQLIVSGEPDKLYEDLDLFDDDRGIDMELENAVPDPEEREALEADDAAMQGFRDECRDRDESDPISDLIKNTGRKMVRFYVRNKHAERIALPEDSWRWDQKRIEREARRLNRALRLDWKENADAMIELVQNATYGGLLCVIAYVEMTDINKMVQHCLHGDERGRVKLTFTNPEVLVHDHWNGSGHGTGVKGKVVIKFGRGALSGTHGVMALDAKGVGTGYSWDESAGLYKPAFICDPQIELYQSTANQKPDKPASTDWPRR